MKTVKTPKGTELPLVNLKGKDYLMVAHRIQWMNEEVSKFKITTDFLLLDDEQTICKALVEIMDESGNVVKSSQATKRETKKDFSDHTEKAETSAIGRALAILGYGTQFAISDLDEGTRLADSPLQSVKQVSVVQSSIKETSGWEKVARETVELANDLVNNPKTVPMPKKSTFRKPTVAPTNGASDGWE